MACITRDKKGTFRSPRGAVIRDKTELARLRKAALPAHYRDACYAPRADATIQAVGRDPKSGRLQYRYHDKHTAAQTRRKFARLLKFAKLLPPLRRAVRRQLRAGGARRRSDKEHVTHQAIHLLDQCRFRVGNPMYLASNASHGLSNLDASHVKKLGPREAVIEFQGKAGQLNTCTVRDKDTLAYLRHRRRLAGGGPGKPVKLFEYTGASGAPVGLHPHDMNTTLRSYGDVTAKDFRTWQANMFFVQAVLRGEAAPAAVRHAAAQLYHTPAVCKSSYLHPDLVAMDPAQLRKIAGRAPPGTSPLAGRDGPAPPLPPKHIEMLEKCLYRLLQHLQRRRRRPHTTPA